MMTDVRLRDFVITTKTPSKFIKELEKVCTKYAVKSGKGYEYYYQYDEE